MTDNITHPPSGLPIRTDDVGGTHYQYVKLDLGGDGVAVPVSGTVPVTQTPLTSGGLTTFRLLSAATTNSTSVKGSLGQLYGWQISNVNAAVRFVKLYNKATAPTVGTDVPVMTVLVPAAGVIHAQFNSGLPFSLGIGLATTTLVTDADATAVALNEVVVHLFYK